MRIFFEGARYQSDQLTNIEPWMYNNFQGGSSFNYLGYYLPKGNSEPVVILPKVFLDDEGNFMENKPSDFVNIQETLQRIANKQGDFKLPEGIDAKALKETVMGISTWVYRSIAHYIERMEESKIAEESNIQNVITQHEEGTSATYLDTILQLFRFAQEHKNLFAFITNLTHQHRNKIVWNKTIRKSLPLMQDGTPIYMNLYSKKKELDFDEELLKLFFSTLRYLNYTYSFDYDSTFHFETYQPTQIEQMLESGRGTRLLRSIRYKYFSDDMVNLWNILLAYFDKAEKVKSHRNSEELLLVRDYDRVFEDMIDQLIGDDNPLKNQKDGKIIDHIYREKDLHNSKSYIYYIADSKYYLEKNDLSSESIYKQYTYAKNVIQYNIDLFNSNKADASLGLRYRDELTEGYNITPNFFIRGKVRGEDINNTKEDHLERIKDKNWDGFRKNTHFPNRLFDRDTLPTQEYTINFLFVLAAYVSNSRNDSYREATRQTFKKDLTNVLNQKYNFYTLTMKRDAPVTLQDEVEKWFKKLNGKIYRLQEKEKDNEIILALERARMAESLLLLWDLKKNSNFYGFERFQLGGPIPETTQEKKSKEYQEVSLYSLVAESEKLFEKKINTSLLKTVLFGCYKDKKHLDWITENKLYNIRSDAERKGGVKKGLSADILVLYNFEKPEEYSCYRINTNEHSQQVPSSDKIMEKYPNKQEGRNYWLYKIKTPALTINSDYYPQDVFDFVDDDKKGAPVFIIL